MIYFVLGLVSKSIFAWILPFAEVFQSIYTASLASQLIIGLIATDLTPTASCVPKSQRSHMFEWTNSWGQWFKGYCGRFQEWASSRLRTARTRKHDVFQLIYANYSTLHGRDVTSTPRYVQQEHLLAWLRYWTAYTRMHNFSWWSQWGNDARFDEHKLIRIFRSVPLPAQLNASFCCSDSLTFRLSSPAYLREGSHGTGLSGSCSGLLPSPFAGPGYERAAGTSSGTNPGYERHQPWLREGSGLSLTAIKQVLTQPHVASCALLHTSSLDITTRQPRLDSCSGCSLRIGLPSSL
jgi:hypothetical protein